jgi:cellulose synthase/poly-beta-1,6-N-acetylglucosamine synthase-like glycosyltransferase
MTKILAFDRDRRSSHADSATRLKSTPRTSAVPTPLRRTEGSHARPGEVEVAASVVVPTRGRPQLLNRCLASLVLQRFDPARFEIIVVDDGPDDDTREVVAGWAAHTAGQGPRITYIPSMGPHGPWPRATTDGARRAAASSPSPTTTPLPAPTG